jgi:hypothetical protein
MEPVGITEAQVKALLESQEQRWQAKMEEEFSRRLAVQREDDLQQHLARKAKRNQNRVQTAQSPWGGQSL